MSESSLKAVSIGGGCGAVQILLGLSHYLTDLTGIIAVTDTGRSTGKVRRLASIPAPGDIRNAIGTLAGDATLFGQLIQHRLKVPSYEPLNGVAFGNLMLAALTQTQSGLLGGTAVSCPVHVWVTRLPSRLLLRAITATRMALMRWRLVTAAAALLSRVAWAKAPVGLTQEVTILLVVVADKPYCT